jgi:N-formylglutamate deformylase
MTDEELLSRFAGGTIDPGSFGHREHVRLAWLCLARYGRPETERLLLAGLRALAARAGRPDKFSAPLTLSWIARIDRARAELGDHTFDDLLRHEATLADRRGVQEMPQTI